MGLELVEFSMDIEERFGIKFTEETELDATVSSITDYVYQQLQSKDKRICYSSYCFYKLRSIVCETTDINKRKIRPSTHINSVIPYIEEKRLCRAVLGGIGKLAIGFPGKKFIPCIIGTLYLFLFLTTLLIFIISIIENIIAGIAVILFAIVLFLIIGFIDRIFLTNLVFPNIRLSDHFQTFGDVAKKMESNLTAKDVENISPNYTRTQILDILKHMLADNYGVKYEDMTETTDLVKDLNMG